MQSTPAKPQRRSIRIPGYDYSLPGGYFVTIVIQGRKSLLGTISNGEMHLNRYGDIVSHAWYDLPNHYDNIVLDAFMVMPDHVHGILFINEGGRDGSLREKEGLPDPFAGARRNIASPTLIRPVAGSLIDGKGGSPDKQEDMQNSVPERAEQLARISETRPYGKYPLSEVLRAFKSFSARRINLLRHTPGLAVWQRNYYEHVIRNHADYLSKRNYILNNPLHWKTDKS